MQDAATEFDLLGLRKGKKKGYWMGKACLWFMIDVLWSDWLVFD